jgi:hypothetical protein
MAVGQTDTLDLGSLDSLYEPNTDARSTAAGNNGSQAEDQPVAGAAEKKTHEFMTSERLWPCAILDQ